MKILALTLKVVVVWRTEMHDGCEALALQDNLEASSDFPLPQLEAVEPDVCLRAVGPTLCVFVHVMSAL